MGGLWQASHFFARKRFEFCYQSSREMVETMNTRTAR